MTSAPTASLTRLPRTDLEVLPLNLGGNTFGWTSDRETSFAVLDAFVAAGGSFIDTADAYAAWAEGSEGGDSETVLGEWFEARGNREEIVLATKVGAKPSRTGLSAANVEAALDESLERLRTDRIDLYYAHYDDEAVSIEEQVRIADGLVRSGRVRHLGLSNYSPERMREWFEVATREGLTVPVAIQPHYNLLARAAYEKDYAPIAREFDAAVMPYFYLASGLLTGKYSTKEDLEGRARKGMVQDQLTEDALAVVDVLTEVAATHDAEPASVAIAWLLAKGTTAPIASASTPEQLPALLAGTALELSAQDVAALDEASAPFA